MTNIKISTKHLLFISLTILFGCRDKTDSPAVNTSANYSSITHSNGYVDTYNYSTNGALKSITYFNRNTNSTFLKEFEYEGGNVTKAIFSTSGSETAYISPVIYKYAYDNNRLLKITLGIESNFIKLLYNNKNEIAGTIHRSDSIVFAQIHSSKRPGLKYAYDTSFPEDSSVTRYSYDNYGNCIQEEMKVNGVWKITKKSTFYTDAPNPEVSVDLYQYFPQSAYFSATDPHMIATSFTYFHLPSIIYEGKIVNDIITRDEKNRPIKIISKQLTPLILDINSGAAQVTSVTDTLTITYQ